MLKVCPLTVAILDGGRVTGHNFESLPPKDHSCHVCFKLTHWFQKRRLLNIFSIGSYVKTKSSHGGHLEFPISAKNKNLVYDHPMNISAKFGSNLFCGFRKKDENVKFP